MKKQTRVRFNEGNPQFVREKYQRGSMRKVPKQGGFNWEFRYRITENGARVQKQQTFDGAEFPTESAVRLHVEHKLLKLNEGAHDFTPDVRFGAILDRYLAEELPPKLS